MRRRNTDVWSIVDVVNSVDSSPRNVDFPLQLSGVDSPNGHIQGKRTACPFIIVTAWAINSSSSSLLFRASSYFEGGRKPVSKESGHAGWKLTLPLVSPKKFQPHSLLPSVLICENGGVDLFHL